MSYEAASGNHVQVWVRSVGNDGCQGDGAKKRLRSVPESGVGSLGALEVEFDPWQCAQFRR